MLQYRLVYFNGRARGEVIRLIFASTGTKYEDVRIEFKDWPQWKLNVPLGKIPVLEVKDEGNNLLARMSQSRAIGRFLANKFYLAGASDLEKAKADEIVDQVNDVMDTMVRMLVTKDTDKKAAKMKSIINDVLPFNLKYFESILSQNKTGYLVGNGLTWADLYLMNKWDNFPDKLVLFKNFPLVKAHDERIRSMPRISEYLKSRPVTKL